MDPKKLLIDYTKPQIFSQTDNIRDHIFPLIKVKVLDSKYVGEPELIGTGFLIGARGFGLTAAHVLDQCFTDLGENEAVVAIFWNMFTEYVAFQVTAHEKHPTEDVGLVKLSHEDLWSIFEISDTHQNATCEYGCWGYPMEIAEELKKLYEGAQQQPDLIYTQGYIRRRITRDLFPTMIFRGMQFYELSEQVGEGNSGAPVIWRRSIGAHKWQIIGIYIGEKGSKSIGEKDGSKVSYAVRAEAFVGWQPALLKGRTVREESTAHGIQP